MMTKSTVSVINFFTNSPFHMPIHYHHHSDCYYQYYHHRYDNDRLSLLTIIGYRHDYHYHYEDTSNSK